MVALEWESHGSPVYRLFLETDVPDSRLHEAAQALERALGEGYHYRYARELGPVRALRVAQGQAACAHPLRDEPRALPR